MAGLGRRAAILTLSRFANYGLMLVSPVILVRLLSVGGFGRYREFLLYGSLLQSFASYAINDSLLYFVPRYPDSVWRVVRQAVLLIATSSATVMLAVTIADFLGNGTLLGGFRIQLAVYVLVSVNLDFWEALLLARDEPLKMFAYTAGRLFARMLVVVVLATVTRDVQAIVWGLVGLETVRFAASAFLWRHSARERLEPPIKYAWREQLQFCVPAGTAVLLSMWNQSLGSVVVAKAIGTVALAQLTVGTYGDPIIVAVRNSISTVLLPEMVRLGTDKSRDPMSLWARCTVVNCILLFPCAVLVFHFAEQLIVTVFGTSYLPAVAVLQIYVLGILRSCFDFSPPLRAINRTRPLLFSNLIALLVNAACLWLLVPRYGVVGAMWSWVVSAFVDALYLGASVTKLYRTSVKKLLPWKSICYVGIASAGAFAVIAPDFWVRSLGIGGVVLGSAVYVAVFVAIALAMRVPEALSLARRARRIAASAAQ